MRNGDVNDYEPDVLRVLQPKEETKAYYDKIARVYDLLAECRRVLRPGGRLVVVGLSKEGKAGLALKTFEWTHRHFPNLIDCRPIYQRRAIEAAGFLIRESAVEHMWVPVEIVSAVKP